ncbi:prolyl oligopeptidase family serine peptidase [Kribbella sp. CA-293567]|uniref:prolyl oligopeptidase family serine peptidase n=1 Tax=Kribbella sp. CA-293567 TaxID=3002436 RepID=UPI0022DDE5B4|nr:prolyl oligopeptidase family serine peptidase [Kribbella sp. CA-293567]WBQ08236.1 prolyl oligopeptidase family serine peptidase [Kribbella sp. CA-293567]
MPRADLSYPDAERSAVVELLHGRQVADPYRWLEDATDQRTQSWQTAQDDLWLTHAARLPGRYRFRTGVATLSNVEITGTPTWRDGRRFFLRKGRGQEHPVLWLAGPEGERSLVDPIRLDPSGRTTLDRWQPSPDGRLLAFQVSQGNEASVLRVLAVDTGELVDEPIDRCRYSPVAWRADNQSFYFVRSRQLLLHRVGGAEDVQVLAGEASYGLEISADGHWLTISVADRNEQWVVELSGPDFDPVLAQQGLDARSALAVGPDGRLYVATTLEAPSGRICVADPREPGHENWRELIAEEPGAPLSQLAVLDGVLLVGRTRQALSELTAHDPLTGDLLHEVPLPGPGTVADLGARPEGGHEAWFSYTDSVTPPTVHRYDARTRRVTPWSSTNHPGPKIAARQLTYPSRDGTPIRMVVLARDGQAGPRPTLLYGYGGFGLSITPTYSAFALAWVEAGGVFVTANLRGGGEQGDLWHRAGTLGSKQNVIDDYLAAAETLIAQGWTTSGQLGICGESNGGLLVGAALTQRPELFAAAVCSAPLLDMVRYEQSGLGASWVGEYGSAGDPDQLAALLAYSPYHRVAEVDYPAVLFTVFGADSRVDPLHARKMCAALQHSTTGSRPILFRYESDAGHLPAATSRGVGLAADILAFLAFHTGLAP